MPYDMDADFRWFIQHQEELVKLYDGKTLAIRNGEVLGAFDSAADAVNSVSYEMGEYLIQLCISGEDAYSITIHTPGLILQ